MSSTHTAKESSAKQRRKYIKDTLSSSSSPLTATYFAEKLSVSRQIIVSDVALLRASGLNILATPKGYLRDKGRKRKKLGTHKLSHRRYPSSSDRLQGRGDIPAYKGLIEGQRYIDTVIVRNHNKGDDFGIFTS